MNYLSFNILSNIINSELPERFANQNWRKSKPLTSWLKLQLLSLVIFKRRRLIKRVKNTKIYRFGIRTFRKKEKKIVKLQK